MNKNSLNWGVGITLVWLIVIALLWFFGDLKSPESLNELGDALAGIFAPVAFLWLVLGYRQQGKQLEQNTQALEQQERALQLQIDEMRESVKQQKSHFEIQLKQLEGLSSGAEPYLYFVEGKGGFTIHDKSIFLIVCTIKNIGLGAAKNIQIYSKSSMESIPYKDETNNHVSTSILLPNNKMPMSFELSKENLTIYHQEMVRLTFEIRYEDTFKNKFSKSIVGNAVKSKDNNYSLDVFFN